MGTSRHDGSFAVRYRSTAASASWPSRRMSALTSNVSPTTRLTGNRPPSSSGRTLPIQTVRTSPRAEPRNPERAMSSSSPAPEQRHRKIGEDLAHAHDEAAAVRWHGAALDAGEDVPVRAISDLGRNHDLRVGPDVVARGQSRAIAGEPGDESRHDRDGA